MSVCLSNNLVFLTTWSFSAFENWFNESNCDTKCPSQYYDTNLHVCRF